jgi:hypothetical protein
MVSNRKNNYARNGFLGIEMFDNEPKVHKTPFRDMEINLTDDEKKSRKSLKKSKKSKKNQKGGSKKSRRHKSKKTNRSRSNDSDRISSKNNRIPNYLRFDLEHLIGDDINYYHAGGYAHTSSRNSSPKISRKNSRRH